MRARAVLAAPGFSVFSSSLKRRRQVSWHDRIGLERGAIDGGHVELLRTRHDLRSWKRGGRQKSKDRALRRRRFAERKFEIGRHICVRGQRFSTPPRGGKKRIAGMRKPGRTALFGTPPIMEGSVQSNAVQTSCLPSPPGHGSAVVLRLPRPPLLTSSSSRQLPKPFAMMPPSPASGHGARDHSVKAAANPNPCIDVQDQDANGEDRQDPSGPAGQFAGFRSW